MNNDDIEQTRLKYLYRRLILQGKIKVGYESAKRLIGPDCAYHLYATYGVEAEVTEGKKHKKEENKKL